MKIQANMNLKIALDPSQGKYISVKKKGNTLEIISTTKKPSGGAKDTLTKIQKIIECIDIDDTSKKTLSQISKTIDNSYASKNDKKFLYKTHTKKVHRCAERIAHLTQIAKFPTDVLSVLNGFMDAQGLGRLMQVNKAAAKPLQSDWTRRAIALGWTGDEKNVAEAKAFCHSLTKTLDKMGLHTIANQFISSPDETLTLSALAKIGSRIHYHSIHKDMEPLIIFLAHKTLNLHGPALQGSQGSFGLSNFFKNFEYGRHIHKASTLIPLAQLMKNLVHEPNLGGFTRSNLDKNEASIILNLFPHIDLDSTHFINLKNGHGYISPIFSAMIENNLGWVQALMEKGASINKESKIYKDDEIYFMRPLEIALKNKNNEIIELLIKAKVHIPKHDSFLPELMQHNSSEHVLLVLNRLAEEDVAMTHSLMNKRSFYPGWKSTERTLLQQAIKYNHSEEVLNKLVEMGANINPTRRSSSPLLYAGKHKKIQASIWLTNQGALAPPKKKWFK